MHYILISATIFGAIAASAGAKDVKADVTVTYIASFTNKVGAHPGTEPIVAIDGNYYGVLPEESRNDVGSIYRVTLDGDLTVLHKFRGPDGAAPIGRLLQASDGALYGATYAGGHQKNCGTVFKITSEGQFNTLHIFSCGKRGGANPSGGLIQSKDGLLYGLAEDGGLHGDGIIYSLSLTGVYSIVSNFTYKTTGSKPKGELLQVNDGTFFGIASKGGPHQGGTLFNASSDGTLIKKVAFALGTDPNSGLAYESATNDIFGTYGFGDIYRYGKVQHSGATRLVLFGSAPIGYTMQGGLTLSSDGHTLYGFGSNFNGGCIFTIDPATRTTLLINGLKGNAQGNPTLTETSSVIGVTKTGGDFDDGVVFEMTQ